MKYSQLINFNPIDSIIQINEADDKFKAVNLVKSYVMSKDMAEKLRHGIIKELQFNEVVDNKGVLLVGNYGTGKSHLMSVISSIATDEYFTQFLQNSKFADFSKEIAGKFEALRIEIGSTGMSLRDIIFSRVIEDFSERGLSFSVKDKNLIVNHKETLREMMEIFNTKYPDKGYLIVVDEFLDYLGGRKENEIKLDLGFMRELGEIVKYSRLRVIFGVQEKLFDNPTFSFVSDTLNRVKDRFEQVIIRKEDTAYVVSERILKKTPEQKAFIRNHLQNYSNLYRNMIEQMDEYVDLFPIHPAYIEVFNKIYIIENRHILKNISEIINGLLDKDLNPDEPGIISFDSYWPFIKGNFGFRAYTNTKEVVEKSEQLEEIINRSYPKKAYKPLALQIIYALSVHRLTTGDISVRTGLTSENLKDDLCLYVKGMPENDSDFLQSVIQQALKDTMVTVNGQFIEHNKENGQYYLDLKKDIDYEQKVIQKAAIIDDESLNRSFFDVVYFALEWDQKEYVQNFDIYEHSINWVSHNVYRSGYLFLGTPEKRPTAQPPEDYYFYVLPPYGENIVIDSLNKEDEVFIEFKYSEEFKKNLKLYAASLALRELSEEKNKGAYQNKVNEYKKYLTRYLSENKNTCFNVIYRGERKTIIEVLASYYNKDFTFKETVDTVVSICLNDFFSSKYPEFPVFKTKITANNKLSVLREGIDYFAGRTTNNGRSLLDSFGLIENDKISLNKSKIASELLIKLSKINDNSVLNFSDLFDQKFNDYVDRRFLVSYELMSIVLLGLVYTGNAVMTLKNNSTLTASNLDSLIKTNVQDIFEFKHVSKPKDMSLAEIVYLFEILGISQGLATNPKEREKGVELLLRKAKEFSDLANQNLQALDLDFNLWGEPLLSSGIMQDYQSSISKIKNEFENYGLKYNTVAKLNNFSLTKGDIKIIGENISKLKVVTELVKFRNLSILEISYLKNVETSVTDESLLKDIENVKNEFRNHRDSILKGRNGDTVYNELKIQLCSVKEKYIEKYISEHQKKRLGVAEAKRKGEIIDSNTLSNLKRLKSISILSSAKLSEIENALSNLKICYELTKSDMKSNHICPHCSYRFGENSKLVHGQLEEIEDKLQNLQIEWTRNLVNTISDPLVVAQVQFLGKDQREVIDKFMEEKRLPNIVDVYFVNSITTLLNGFDAIVIDSKELISKLDQIGPCDLDTFREKLDAILLSYLKGKDRSKSRIIVMQGE